MAFTLDGKVALVTGGARGIGAGIADLLAEAGARVVIADRDADAAATQAAKLIAAGHDADMVVVDLADEASVVAACAAVVARHGAPWLLVNNAGLQDRALLFDATVAEWDRMSAVNARGPFLTMREIGRAMRDAGGGGRIVNVASCSLANQLVKGLVPYVASKGALAGMTIAAGLELLEHGITVNTVNPGGVITPGAIAAKGPLTDGPARRPPPLGMCEPRDIAAAVLFFASVEARFVTNQTVTVDAGWSLS